SILSLNLTKLSSAPCSCSSCSAQEMVVMGQLGRFMDGIKSKLRGGGGRKTGRKKEAAAMMTYDKMDKTESMRVEIRSRQAQKLIAKNLVAADSIGRRNKRFFLAF
ncbi:Os08g0416800, partial [Oryza sativa Japonica Group]